MQTIKDYIAAHRKWIIATIVAIVVIVAPDANTDMIAAIVGAALGWLVPNDQAALGRIYHR